MSSNSSSYIINEDTATLFHKGAVYVAHSENKGWKKLLKAISDNNFNKAVKIIDKMNGVREWASASKKLAVENNAVAFDGRILPNAITKRIIAMIDEDINTAPLEKFLGNLFSNTSSRAIEELYRFLECNDLPITTDGHFLAYKRVSADFKDMYTRSIDNSIGTIVVMPREQVMDDPNMTCSVGLHFASLKYLKSYHGNKLIAIKINPADVVSIPVDYNNSKGRCCRYEVVSELDIGLIHGESDAWGNAVESTHG